MPGLLLFPQQAHMLRHEISASEEHRARGTRKDKHPPIPPPRPEQEKNNDGETKGVVSLLREGHFKGVADIRLRINFFDEFTEIKSEELMKDAGEKMDGLLESVENNIETLLEFNQLSEEQSAAVKEHLETFTQAMNQQKDSFLNTDRPVMDDLISGLNSSFEEFVDLVTLALYPTTEMPEEGQAPAEEIVTQSDPENSADEENGGMTEPQPSAYSGLDLQTTIENLRADFTASLQELTDGLNEIKAFHEPLALKNNGKAYDKFLAILNNMSTVETPANDSSNGETLDTVA